MIKNFKNMILCACFFSVNLLKPVKITNHIANNIKIDDVTFISGKEVYMSRLIFSEESFVDEDIRSCSITNLITKKVYKYTNLKPSNVILFDNEKTMVIKK